MRKFIGLAVVALGLLALIPERSDAGFLFGRFRRPVVQNNFFGTPPVVNVPRARFFAPRVQNNFFGVPQNNFYGVPAQNFFHAPSGRIVIDPYTGRAFFAPY